MSLNELNALPGCLFSREWYNLIPPPFPVAGLLSPSIQKAAVLVFFISYIGLTVLVPSPLSNQ